MRYSYFLSATSTLCTAELSAMSVLRPGLSALMLACCLESFGQRLLCGKRDAWGHDVCDAQSQLQSAGLVRCDHHIALMQAETRSIRDD